MRQRHLYILLAPALICLVGCGQSAPNEETAAIPVTTPAAPPAVTWGAGNGFVFDTNERLLLTTAQVAGTKGDIEVAFPVADDSKAVVNPTESVRKSCQTFKAKVLIADPDRDLAVLQLNALPASLPVLKLAAASPGKDAALRFFGAANGNSAWAATAATVGKVGPIEGSKSPNSMIQLAGAKPFARDAAGGVVVNEANEVVGVVPGESAPDSPVAILDVSELRPMVGAAYRVKATEAYNEGKHLVAVSYGDKALAAWPEDALGYNERGAAYSQMDKFDEAIADYSKSIELEPNFARPYRNRGSAYFYLGKYKEALADCNRAIELDSGYASAYQTRSKVHAKLKMTKEAEDDAKAVAALAVMEQKGLEVPTDWKLSMGTSGTTTTTGAPGTTTKNSDGSTTTVNGDGTTTRTSKRGKIRVTETNPTGGTGRRYVMIQIGGFGRTTQPAPTPTRTIGGGGRRP